MMSFAIVIPNLNQSHYLTSALESLRHQSVSFRLAVMDGGSSDNFRSVIEPYSDIITVISSQPDAGQAAAIREGKNKIEGDIVAWLNADDYYFPDALEKVASCFAEDPQLDVAYGDAVHVSPEGFFKSYFPAIQEFNHGDLTRSNFICQPACFVRQSAYEAVGGIDERLEYTMDWDLWCRLAEAGAKFQYIHEVLAAVRYYPETKTLSRSRKRYLEIYRLENKYGKRLLPLSWFGHYYFDLTFKARKTLLERAYSQAINLMRVLKKNLQQGPDKKPTAAETNYGFYRFEPIVHRHATIHLPWYDKRQWRRLYLQVEPVNDRYRILVNDKLCDYRVSENSYFLVEVPLMTKPYRKIAIVNLQRDTWKFCGLWFDVT